MGPVSPSSGSKSGRKSEIHGCFIKAPQAALSGKKNTTVNVNISQVKWVGLDI